MKRCPQCGLSYLQRPSACPACGAVDKAAQRTLPLRGNETREELVELFFGRPVTYRRAPFETFTQILFAWLLPALAGAMAAPRWLTFLLAGLAVLLTLSAVRLGRRRVTIARDGLWSNGALTPWQGIHSVRLVAGSHQEREPIALIISTGRGEVSIARETTRASGLSSLRNLASIIEQILATGPAR